ncbi:MAG TPA: DUF502 domain-containing protein [Gemmatimonadaceae bacterium]|nr:DUF502 domain-containing protein [Gemmatimonadaceae bacterium]
MTKLLNYFLRGLVVVVPIGVTIWVCVKIFRAIDDLLGFAAAGTGFLLMLVMVTLVGFLASTIVARSIGTAFESLLGRLPFVSLLYSSTKDMLNAFVGEKRRFDKPVLVSLTPDGSVKILGFLTSESLSLLGEAEYATVYMPTSYGVAGHLLMVPSARVTRLEADAAEVMAYIISGGVTAVKPGTEIGAAR